MLFLAVCSDYLAESATSGFGWRFGFTGGFADGVLVRAVGLGGIEGDGKMGKRCQYRKDIWS